MPRFDVKPVAARSGARRRDRRRSSADALADGKKVVAARRLRCDPQPAPDREVLDFIERFQIPLRHHPRRQGHRRRKPSAVDRRLLRQWPRQRVEGVPRRGRRDRPSAIASTSTPPSTIATTCSTAGSSSTSTFDSEIDKVYKADRAIVADAKPGDRGARTTRSSRRSSSSRRRVDGRDYDEQRVIRTHRRASIPARWRRRSSRHAAAARHRACRCRRPSRLARLLPRARGRPELPQARRLRPDGGSRQRRHRREVRRIPTAPWSSAAATAATCRRLRADDRRRARHPRHLGHLQRRRVQADQALPAVVVYGESGLVEFENPDYAAYARACGADGYSVETLDEFEAAFADALASGTAGPHRRPHHPLRAAALQPVAGGHARRRVRDDWHRPDELTEART